MLHFIVLKTHTLVGVLVSIVFRFFLSPCFKWEKKAWNLSVFEVIFYFDYFSFIFIVIVMTGLFWLFQWVLLCDKGTWVMASLCEIWLASICLIMGNCRILAIHQSCIGCDCVVLSLIIDLFVFMIIHYFLLFHGLTLFIY